MMFKKKYDMSKLDQISCASKLSLKKSCFAACDGDVKKAKEIYDYFAEGLELPEQDPIPPSLMKKIESGIDDLSGIYEKNKDGIAQVWGFIQSMRGKANVPAAASTSLDIPPLPAPKM